MSDDGQVVWFRGALKRSFNKFDRLRQENRAWAFAFRVAIVALGSLTTVTIGLQSNSIFPAGIKSWMSVAALFFSAAVTVGSACELLFDYRWTWVRYAATAIEIESISDDLGSGPIKLLAWPVMD